jgi:acyl carrier protein
MGKQNELFKFREGGRDMDIETTVKEIISEQLGVEAADIKMESDFQKDLGADSLDVVELIMQMEDKFKVSIPDEEAKKIRVVADVVRFIGEKKPS